MKSMRWGLPLLFATILGSTTARAEVIYSYVGPNFTTASGDYVVGSSHVSGFFTAAAPLINCSPCDLVTTPPGDFSWSFSDTLNTVTSGHIGTYNGGFTITTDATGMIQTWLIELVGGAPFPNPDCHAGPGDCFVATQNQIPVANSISDLGDYQTASGFFEGSTLISDEFSKVTGVWTISQVDEPTTPLLLLTAALMTCMSSLALDVRSRARQRRKEMIARNMRIIPRPL